MFISCRWNTVKWSELNEIDSRVNRKKHGDALCIFDDAISQQAFNYRHIGNVYVVHVNTWGIFHSIIEKNLPAFRENPKKYFREMMMHCNGWKMSQKGEGVKSNLFLINIAGTQKITKLLPAFMFAKYFLICFLRELKVCSQFRKRNALFIC